MKDYISLESLDKDCSDLLLHLSAPFASVMRQVYLWMTFALCISGITAHAVANSPLLVSYMFVHQQWLFWCLAGVLLALVFILSAFIDKLSMFTATLLFILFSLVNGVVLSSIFLTYTMESIGSVFFVTAGLFLTMSIIGYTTKKDLTSMGNLFYMALWGLILSTIVNVFIHSSMMTLLINYAGVIIFIGLTAYDTQKIKQRLLSSYLSPSPTPSTSLSKIALLGALELYLDFINMFLYLLRLFGKKK